MFFVFCFVFHLSVYFTEILRCFNRRHTSIFQNVSNLVKTGKGLVCERRRISGCRLPEISLHSHATYHQYHPTSGLMRILHFNWLRYSRTIGDNPRVANFSGFSFYCQINSSSTEKESCKACQQPLIDFQFVYCRYIVAQTSRY